MPYEISSLQKNAAPDEAVQSRGYILIEHDMAKTLDISPAELSAIECGKKPVPGWFIPALEKHYGIGETCAHTLRFLSNRLSRWSSSRGWIFYRTRWQLTRLSRRPSSRLRKAYGHI